VEPGRPEVAVASDGSGVKRVALVLRKDLLVLRRSPLLLAILLAYPLAIAVLVGLVASYGSSKPRVALVDEDNLPATLELAGHVFHVDRTIREVSKNVKLVRLDVEEADRQLRDGRVVAVVTVPPGFISTLRGMVESPQLQLELSTGTTSSRVEQQVQALVYSLNRQLQRAYIRSNLRYVSLILKGGDGSFIGRPITVLGIEKAERLLAAEPQTPKTRELLDFLHDARLALANTDDALRSTAHPIELVREPRRGRTWALSAEVEAYALGLTITFLALLVAAGSLAAERDENVVGRLSRGLVGLGQLVWSKVALAAAVALGLGLAVALAFGVIIEVGGVTGGEPWRRLPLLAVGLVLAGGALGARGPAGSARAGGALGLARRGARRDADRLPRPDPAGGRPARGLAERPAPLRARGALLPVGAL
jgi:ABC-2 type transport system permease protein